MGVATQRLQGQARIVLLWISDHGGRATAGGVVQDWVAALLLCASTQADYTMVNGWVVVRQGEITTRGHGATD